MSLNLNSSRRLYDSYRGVSYNGVQVCTCISVRRKQLILSPVTNNLVSLCVCTSGFVMLRIKQFVTNLLIDTLMCVCVCVC